MTARVIVGVHLDNNLPIYGIFLLARLYYVMSTNEYRDPLERPSKLKRFSLEENCANWPSELTFVRPARNGISKAICIVWSDTIKQLSVLNTVV